MLFNLRTSWTFVKRVTLCTDYVFLYLFTACWNTRPVAQTTCGRMISEYWTAKDSEEAATTWFEGQSQYAWWERWKTQKRNLRVNSRRIPDTRGHLPLSSQQRHFLNQLALLDDVAGSPSQSVQIITLADFFFYMTSGSNFVLDAKHCPSL